MHRNKQRIGKNKETEEYIPNEGISQNPRRRTKQSGDDNLPNKEFKVMIIQIINELGRRMDEHSEKFNKKLENTKKSQRS